MFDFMTGAGVVVLFTVPYLTFWPAAAPAPALSLCLGGLRSALKGFGVLMSF